MIPRKSILLFTNSEYGQANVMLATAHDLLLRSHLDVHLASFPILQPRVADIHVSGRSVTFHAISGRSMFEAHHTRLGDLDLSHPTGLNGAVLAFNKLTSLVLPWDSPEYIEQFKDCMELIKTISPALVVVDPLFPQSHDACKSLSHKYIVLTPVSLKEFVGPAQPNMAPWWKYPVTCSGFPYPLPWYLIPLNVYLLLRVMLVFIFDPNVRRIISIRKKYGLTWNLPTFAPYTPAAHYITASLPEMEFPYTIPENITFCGPILLAVTPITESDPEMAKWLQQAPTILVNLGSHVVSDAQVARELASGLRVILDCRPDLQVLWKLRSKDSVGDSLSEVLGKEMKSKRVRIESWLAADPLAIMQSGNIVCSVHHGGGNSFYEATGTGIPQVILPVWYDTYDFAERAERLGIGIYGNRRSAPGANAAEFGKALQIVVGDGRVRAEAIRERAMALAVICQKAGGRATACAKMMEMAGVSEDE